MLSKYLRRNVTWTRVIRFISFLGGDCGITDDYRFHIRFYIPGHKV